MIYQPKRKWRFFLIVIIACYSLNETALCSERHEAGADSESSQRRPSVEAETDSNSRVRGEQVLKKYFERYLVSKYANEVSKQEWENALLYKEKFYSHILESKRLMDHWEEEIRGLDWNNVDVGNAFIRAALSTSKEHGFSVIFPNIIELRSVNYWVSFIEDSCSRKYENHKEFLLRGELIKEIVRSFKMNHISNRNPKLNVFQRDRIRRAIRGVYLSSYGVSTWKSGIGDYLQAGAMLEDRVARLFATDVVKKGLDGTESMESEAFIHSLIALDYYMKAPFDDFGRFRGTKGGAGRLIMEVLRHKDFSVQMKQRWIHHSEEG